MLIFIWAIYILVYSLVIVHERPREGQHIDGWLSSSTMDDPSLHDNGGCDRQTPNK